MSHRDTPMSRSPVQAIRSPLAARPAYSIPQAYVPLARHILQQRLVRHIFFYSAFLCWIQAILSRLSIGVHKPVLLAPFCFSTLALAAVTWLIAALPAIVVRKTYLTTKPTLAASPSALVKSALAKQCMLRTTLTYLLSSLAMLVLHVLFDGDAKLRLFVQSKKHPFYLNPRLIYLTFSQVAVALIYTFRNILLDRFVFRFPALSPSKRLITPLTVLHTLLISTLLTALSAPLTCLFFAVSRSLLPLIYRLPPLPYLLKPFTAHFLRGSWTLILPLYHFPLLVRGWFMAYTTLTTWEFTSVLFELSISQPITLSPLTADPNLALVSGISISPTGRPGFPFHHFAYQELRNLASSPTPQAASLRSALFSDQKYTPTLWSQLIREALLLLGHDFQILLHRGQQPPALSPATAATAATATTSLVADANKQQQQQQQKKQQQQTGNGALPFPSTPVKFVSAPLSAFRPPAVRDGQRSWTAATVAAVAGTTTTTTTTMMGRSPVQGAAECLASDGPLARAVEEGAGEMEEVVGKVPELFRSVLRERRGGRQSGSGGSGGGSGDGGASGVGMGEGDVVSASVGVRRVIGWVEETKKGLRTWVERDGCPVLIKNGARTLYDWWTRERLHKLVENAVPNRELDLVVFDMLSHLVSASLTEDQYGFVQRDIPKILEAMVKFLGEVDKWRSEILAAASTTSATGPTTDNRDQSTPSSAAAPEPQNQLPTQQADESEERARACAILSEMSDGLKESIGRIVRTFGNKLGAFKFPPSVAKGLQTFLDYC